ncbi:S-adenosyl-L-methionine-dependent methyltransferase [Martensiomyces pterosporus]|nr:S-adenosyl-L-methionine-dependent methyltransferase [Martensiomyces pterosporus]
MSVLSYSESGWDTQDDRWDDWEDEEMNTPMKCLFCTHTFQSPITLFRHVKQVHGFDFPKIRAKLSLDFYQSMRVVNYIRTMGLQDPNFGNVSGFSIDGTEAFINDDAYLKPVIEDDTLLYALDELDLDDTASVTSSRIGSLSRTPRVEGFDSPANLKERELMARIRTLEHQMGLRDMEVKFVTEQFEEYRQMVKRQFYDNIDDKPTGEATKDSSQDGEKEPGSDYYFNSYAGNDIHMQMLQDKVRTEGYRDFIYDNKDVFKGKVVLDVGCGTGILSMFAARAGAAKVIAVDNSDIIHKARANVIENKLDGVITLVKGKIEELELPVEKVDIIISEWMGYFLLFEAMLDSVLVARDRFLAPGGLLAPSASYIYLTAISDEDYMNDQVNYWDSVYGFKMSAMKTSGPIAEADVDVIPSSSVMATRALIAEIDHGTTSSADLDFSSSFAIEATRDAAIHAFLGYFDVAFSREQSTPGPSREELCAPVYAANSSGDENKSPLSTVSPKSLWKQPEASMNGFTTGPHGAPTHWKQTVFVLKEPVAAKQGDQVRGQFVCKKSTTNPRELDLEITYYHVPASKKGDPEYTNQDVRHQKYQLR